MQDKKSFLSEKDDILFFILAGGRGSRLAPLTNDCPKPLVRFGLSSRIIDFTLYNCLIYSGNKIIILTQYLSGMIEKYILENWKKAFEIQGKSLRMVSGNDSQMGSFSGTSDAVYKVLSAMTSPSRIVVVLAADHIYRMDYRSLVQFHMEHGKAATVCTIPCEHEQAHRFGIIVNGQDGTINTFLEKPLSLEDIVPPHIYPYASMGIYVFSTAPLLKYLKKNQGKTSHDFGKDILPDIVKSHEAVAYPFLRPDGQPYFWRDIGDLSAYQKASEEFFNGQYKLLRFDNTQGAKQLPTHLLCINTS